jgi:signal transduction histidine kinase
MDDPVEGLTDAQRVRVLEPLAAGLAHDLNNLFAVILSNARFAIDAVGDAPIGEDLGDIAEAARRGGEVVDRLRGIGGRQVLRPERLGLSELIGRMADAIPAAGARLVTSPCEGTGQVRLDRARTERAVLAMVEAARRLAGEQGEVTVRVTEGASGEEAVLEVEGRPAPDERIMARLFEPYCRLVPDAKGGLELAAARGHLVQSGGSLSVGRRDGAMVISVRFPLERDPDRT